MLGKRPHQIQRSTSMSQLRVPPGARPRSAHKDSIPQHSSCPSTPALGTHNPQTLEDPHSLEMKMQGAHNANIENVGLTSAQAGPLKPPYVSLKGSSSSPLPRPSTKVESFLDACFFCKRPLGHGRDIFMYRGDAAFCTEECRVKQISCDEKCSVFASQTTTASNNTVGSPKGAQ